VLFNLPLPLHFNLHLQVIQQRLAALEEDNHKQDDFAAGSDDEEFELPKGSDEGGASGWRLAGHLRSRLVPLRPLG
jgi:hypothetical protein